MLQIIKLGGPVMGVLLFLSVVAATVFFQRFLSLHRAQIKTSDFLKGIYNVLNRQSVVEALSICKETPGPVAQLVHAALLHQDEGRAKIEEAIQQAGVAEITRMERSMGLLLTLAHIAPLLGLLGTVLGLMQMFMTMQVQAPLVQAGDLAGGMWQALVCTAAGLSIAIVAYGGYNLLVGRVSSITLDMDRSASELLAFLSDRERKKEITSS